MCFLFLLSGTVGHSPKQLCLTSSLNRQVINAAIDEDAEHFLHQWQNTNKIVTRNNVVVEEPLSIDVSPDVQEKIEEMRDRDISDEIKHITIRVVLKRE